MTSETSTPYLRIVMAQLDFPVGAIDANASRVIDACRRARDELAADAIVFPELCICGYPPEDLLLRPHFQEYIEEAVERVTREVRDIVAIIGHPLRQDGALFNVASVISQGAVCASYRKQHLPNYSVFDEKRYFQPGNEACVVPVRDIPVGVTICEDVWEPGPAQQAAAAGARVLINLNASPFHAGKGREREELLQQRTAETGLPVMYVNLVGGQDELVFDGGSLVVSAAGEVTQRAAFCEEQLSPVDFSMDTVAPLPGDCVAYLEDLEAIYRVLVLGVRDYINKNGFPGAVIGLSGGIDSALTLAIAVDAIGADRVNVVMMPSRYTSAMSLEDARAEAEALQVEYHEISIEPVFSAFLELLREFLAGTRSDATEENIQARCRGVLLMALSNKQHRILLTTGNKSEMSVGYATLYGDMAGGFAPIKDVPKLLVYRLSEYRNRKGRVIPERVITRPPSAELAADQKDEDSLPPYEVLDPILERYIEQDRSVEQIVADGFDGDVVLRIATLVDRNEYKRRQAPPGIRITQRAFGRDRRYPITSGYSNNRASGKEG
ncbi:MAG: NAD+ synthase [Gammaproteobacteria bacterium]|nr:MAG: NAD+ synthase [Gammaproteobacteria bacterium]